MAKNTRIIEGKFGERVRKPKPRQPALSISLPDEANPIEWITLSPSDDPTQTRNIYCRYYAVCLDYAVVQRWEGFACLDCSLWKDGKEGGEE